MSFKCKSPFLAVFLVLAFSLISSLDTRAAQVYVGDGATNNGAGGWTNTAPAGDCLSCHGVGGSAPDKSAYLLTGHKNMLKKVTAGKPWTFSDGSSLRTSDTPAAGSLYNSGSIFDWMLGQITVGSGPDIPFPPNTLAGTQQDLFYIFGGWRDPSQLDTIWRGGFTGEQFASGNYECARCHTAGYRFDDTGTEPTFNGSKISAADFSRVPTDYDPATGPTASWMQDGVTCERCHVANDGTTNHAATGTIGSGIPSKPTGTASTALCMECHRTEIVDQVANTITFDTGQYVQDGGSCSDGVSPDYATCLAIQGNTWNYAPFLDHIFGLTFLNSPHARYTGTVALNNQNSSDLSVNLPGTYSSYFQDTGGQGGCTTCHDVHQSLTQATATPMKKNCTDCHSDYANFLSKTNHKITANTPYDLAGGNIDQACAVCHISQGFHLFRIKTDPAYSTFPSAAAFYGGQTTANTASGEFTTAGAPYPAVWTDVDLACGQCHVGNSASIGLPLTVEGAPVFDKPTLAQNAICIHHQPLVHVDFGPNGSVSPAGIYNPLYGGMGNSPTFTFVPAAGYEVHSMNVDGAIYYTNQTSYQFNNLSDCHHLEVEFSPMPAIVASAGPNGTISPLGSTLVNTGTDSPPFTVTANVGYKIANVIIDGATSVGAGAASPFTYTFKKVQGSSHTIAASFAPITYNMTVSAGTNGIINPTGNYAVNYNANQAFTITATPGYIIDTLTDTGTTVSAATGLTSYTYQLNGIQADHTIAVTFKQNPNTKTITATVTGTGTINQPTTNIVFLGSNVTYNFAPGSNFRLGSVYIDNVNKGALASYTFRNVQADHTIAVNFVPDTFTTSVFAAGKGVGTITDSIDTTIYYSGTASAIETTARGGSITYTFNPATNYHVSGITVDGSSKSISPTYTFSNITMNHSLSVSFAHN
jgi:hypothetical protein